jgi:hypothetical protein
MPATSRHYSGETNCRRIIFVPRESSLASGRHRHPRLLLTAPLSLPPR